MVWGCGKMDESLRNSRNECIICRYCTHTSRSSKHTHLVQSSQAPRRWVYHCPHITVVDIEARRGIAACPESPSSQVPKYPHPELQVGMCTAHPRVTLQGTLHTPDLAGLLFNGLHRAFHGAQQRLDLTGRLLQEKAGHKLVHVASSLVHLWREE